MPRPRKKLSTDTAQSPEDLFVEKLHPDMISADRSKSDQMYSIIRSAILELQLPPGASLNEKKICERLQISRTPLREAILQLSSEHLVTVVPSSWTLVSPIDLQDVFDGQLIREAIEMSVVRLAAARMSSPFEARFRDNIRDQTKLAARNDMAGFHTVDEEFHQLICECGASPRVWRVIHSAKAQLDRVRRLALPIRNYPDLMLAEHTAILNGLIQRDADAAAKAMQSHLHRAFSSIGQLIAEKKQFFSTTPL